MVDQEDFVGGSLSLDFVNTVSGIRGGVQDDRLERYEDLLEWAVLGSAIARSHANSLATIARRRPEMSVRTLAEAKVLRESLHAVFSAALRHRAPSKQSFDFVNERLGIAMSHARIKRGAEKFEWG